MFSVEELRQFGFTPRMLFPLVSMTAIVNAETELGFPIPQLLSEIFLKISNGIAGFSYDIMGVEGGCDSHCGTLVGTYKGFASRDKSDTEDWKFGLLPFCHWGCYIFSCVDCTESNHPIYTREDSGVWPEEYELTDFFEMWLNGKVDFSEENVEIVTQEIINPFTRKKTTISSRVRKKRPM